MKLNERSAAQEHFIDLCNMLDLSATLIRRLGRGFKRATGFQLIWVAPDGSPLAGSRNASPGRLETRVAAIQETLRWGDPCVMMDAGGSVTWAVPIMYNSQVLGGLVVEGVSMEGRDARGIAGKVRAGCAELLRLAAEHNLTNLDQLAARRAESNRERERAEAIHLLKEGNYDEIRDLYLREEPMLLAAIKRGERGAARGIVNRVLVGIYQMARNRPNLLKSLALELVVMMSRAAVESGADPTLVLGCFFETATPLAALSREEVVSAWLG